VAERVDLMIQFQPNSTQLTPQAEAALQAFAAKMAGNAERMQLRVFTTGDSDQALQARRITLARGIAIRNFLGRQGVASTRIDVLGLGLRQGKGDQAEFQIM
jgi:outer membrane protein OmpA-like peptidoglycan-associated protein